MTTFCWRVKGCLKEYIFYHNPRENSRGGAVGILVEKSVRVKKLCSANFSFFESMVALAEYPIGSIRFVVIYRPPLMAKPCVGLSPTLRIVNK